MRFLQPVMAGIVAPVVGFASSFAVVLAGLRAVGADERQAASGLLILCVTMGIVAIGLGLRYRMPISTAWSTPGAALLATSGAGGVGYREALGAFAVTGCLIVLAGLSKGLGRMIARIPVPLASAMLAGVLLPLCLAPVHAVAELPRAAVPIVLTWLVLGRFAVTKRWAVPAALAVSVVAVLLLREPGQASSGLLPVLTWEVPALSAQALVGVALPLFVVTMASQNLPGMGVLAANGYRPDLRPILVSTGTATAVGAPFGGHAVNLAAITAQLAAGPDAHPDPDRRWIASVTSGVVYLFLGLASGVAVSLIATSPPLLIETVAGLALLASLASALHASVLSPTSRDAAVITFAVTASGITLLGIGAPFWGLLSGLTYTLLTRPAKTPPTPPPPATPDAPTELSPKPEHPLPRALRATRRSTSVTRPGRHSGIVGRRGFGRGGF
ncbi:benzoate/H(+) symporter BenE family transporter [Actinocorallia sp. A-T 12471]|uniref:benzoate/H(+) symporter BenE family transporter n=1 Tax=Actinocorallia sp. A-T 12471 TaxID=3089813 RepID=UPI0029CD306D|nr:benzoate/H(+) symporter BenE family transporter [Actinocorallia sp. A-T 12471]MDX6742762.1 benzoate/H(+) symporter BenE family transporter [Actinocorallia sp. A-T 12471]